MSALRTELHSEARHVSEFFVQMREKCEIAKAMGGHMLTAEMSPEEWLALCDYWDVVSRNSDIAIQHKRYREQNHWLKRGLIPSRHALLGLALAISPIIVFWLMEGLK